MAPFSLKRAEALRPLILILWPVSENSQETKKAKRNPLCWINGNTRHNLFSRGRAARTLAQPLIRGWAFFFASFRINPRSPFPAAKKASFAPSASFGASVLVLFSFLCGFFAFALSLLFARRLCACALTPSPFSALYSRLLFAPSAFFLFAFPLPCRSKTASHLLTRHRAFRTASFNGNRRKMDERHNAQTCFLPFLRALFSRGLTRFSFFAQWLRSCCLLSLHPL